MSWGQVQRLGAVALLALSAGFFALRCGTSQEIPFISQRGDARWIMPPVPVSAELEQWGRATPPVTSYLHGLAVAEPPGEVTLTLRAYRGFTVSLNGAPVPGGSDDGARWRRERRIALGPALRPGPNELRIDVANAHGPALVALRIDGLAEPVVSDGSWVVVKDGRVLGAAIAADDTRRNPAARAVESPLEALAAQRDALLAAFVAGLLAFFGLRRFGTDRSRSVLPSAALLVACGLWLWMFIGTFVRIPLEVGFDARHHGYYLAFLREHASVPLATDGWSVYHPPLFYALAAALQWLGELIAGDAGGVVGAKTLPFLAGLANVAVAVALCRRVFPGEPSKHFVGVVFAAVLPMNIYTAAYFSNETFLTWLAGLALLVTIDLLLAPAASLKRALLLGVLLGLALLTKFTALLVAAVIGFFLACKLVTIERASATRALQLLAAVALPPLAIAGWFYLRNVLVFGDPLIANWGNLPGETQKWWQQPGFHTASYYLGFGEAFRHPYLSGFHSYWDSLYTTLWGDGGIGGRVNPSQRHDYFRYEFVSAGYLVAIPATLFVLAGALRFVARALCDPDPRRRAVASLVATLAYAVLFSLTYMSLRLPYFAQAKASYGLVVMPLFTLFFADGFGRLDAGLARRDLNGLRGVAYGWLAVFAAASVLAHTG